MGYMSLRIWRLSNGNAESLFTVIAISVDRLLALLLGLRYRQVVTLKRIYWTVTLFGLVSILGSMTSLFSDYYICYLSVPVFIPSRCYFNGTCFWVVSILGSITSLFSDYLTLWYFYTILGLCLVISIVAYRKIFLTLRNNQVQAQSHVNQGHPRQEIPLNVARYRKTVSSALWVQHTLISCYLPRIIVEILILQRGITLSICVARAFAAALVVLNSSLNPIIYWWKMRQVRLAVKDTVRKRLCLSS